MRWQDGGCSSTPSACLPAGRGRGLGHKPGLWDREQEATGSSVFPAQQHILTVQQIRVWMNSASPSWFIPSCYTLYLTWVKRNPSTRETFMRSQVGVGQWAMASNCIHPSYSPAAALPGSVPGPFPERMRIPSWLCPIPHPSQHRMVCETVSPRHHVPYSLEGAVPEQVLQEFQGGGVGITPCCSRAPWTAQSLEQP